MSAPGPWERLVEAMGEWMQDRDCSGHDGCPFDPVLQAWNALPSPREADLAGEALDALERIRAIGLVNRPSTQGEMFAEACAILRRAGRLS